MRLCSRNRLLFTALALALATACAQERAPINRVQPYALKKAFFVGDKLLDLSDDPEFWAQGTLIDVGYGAGMDGLFTSTYAQPVTRVKFKIEENFLTARLAYENVTNTDGKGAGPRTNDGIVVAMYRITSHFDIKRSYNPQTGEEANILEENNYDRPWYEREYMRVDWSQNLMKDGYNLDTLSTIGIFGGVEYEPITYWVNDPDAEDAPHFDLANGYFDVTNKAFARPQVVDISHLGWGISLIPACWLDADVLGGPGVGTQCNPVELTVRQSFRKVDEADYQPEEWDGLKFKAFGAFTEERKGYDRLYGMTDDRWHRFIARYNIWEKSHYYSKKSGDPVECYTPKTTPVGEDPNRDTGADTGIEANGTADECEVVTNATGFTGSQCDSFKQKCTLPYRARTARPVIWYMTNVSNYEYFDGTDWATQEWDVALRHAVTTAKYAECMRDPEITDHSTCANDYQVLTGQIEEQNDAIRLAWEVDQCRRSLVYRGVDCATLADADMQGRCKRLQTAFDGFKDEKSCLTIADDGDMSLAGQRGYSAAVRHLARQPEMIVLCHSPVQWDDPEACATSAGQRLPRTVSAALCADAIRNNNSELLPQCRAALNARLGDLRYHHINVIQAPQTGSPWGIMVDSVDPLTGMKIAASVNVWSHVTDLASNQIVDLARYIKGELTAEDITEGKYIKDWSQAAQQMPNGAAGHFTASDVAKRLADFAKVSPARMQAVMNGPRDAAANAQLNRKDSQGNSFLDVIRSKVVFDAQSSQGSHYAPIYLARRSMALNTTLEAQLTTTMMQQLAGNFTNRAATGALLGFVSPLRGADPSIIGELRRQRELALADQGACMLNEAPVSLTTGSMADLLERKFEPFNPSSSKTEQFKRAERMRKYVAQRYQFAVIAHEMGHSVGLRHNFVSSSDAYNFRPQYWQLRTNDGKVTAPCTDLVSAEQAAACVGPRWYDPVTAAERDNMIWMFMHSSVMEYPGELTQDMIGIGAYDFGAARMFYGDAVAVYADPTYKNGTDRGNGAVAKMDDFGGMLGWQYEYGKDAKGYPIPIHYSQLQTNYKLIQNCQPVADVEAFRPMDWNEERDGKWDPVMDGMIVSPTNNGKYTRCSSQKIDYVQWDAMAKNNSQTEADSRSAKWDKQGRVRVPYGFATDRWADIGNASVNRHDNGADPYEIFDFFITSQEMNHIFDNYRRNRTTFTVYGSASRALARYNTKMRDTAKGLALFVNFYKRAVSEGRLSLDAAWETVVSDYRANVLASTLAFDHFARQIARPEEGPHLIRSNIDDGVLRSMNDFIGMGDFVVNIPNGAFGSPFGSIGFGGRPIENRLKYQDCGEYCAEYTVNAGSYYEKVWAPMLLTESEDRFISDRRGDFVDARYRNISMADLFPDGFRRLIANNLTGDDFIKGPRLVTDPTAPSTPVIDADGYPQYGLGWISWSGAEPKVCFQSYTSPNLGRPDSGMSWVKCDATPNGYPTMAVDPQVGWEEWKFLVAYLLQYLPENNQTWWLDQMRIWEIGADNDPGFANRIEFHDPNGKTYVAKTYGKEQIFGKTVQRGIAARVLEWANTLMKDAYETDDGDDLDHDGRPDWYLPKLGPSGQPIAKFDPNMLDIRDGKESIPFPGRDDCNATTNVGCRCDEDKQDSRACRDMLTYVPLLQYMRQALATYGMADPSMRGVFR